MRWFKALNGLVSGLNADNLLIESKKIYKKIRIEIYKKPEATFIKIS